MIRLYQESQGRPAPKGAKIPLEKEAAIEAAFRHFGMIPDKN